jgi:hypothetical protein
MDASSHDKNTEAVSFQLVDPFQPVSIRLTGFGLFLLKKTTIPKLTTRLTLSPLRPGLYGVKHTKKKLSIPELDSKSEVFILIPRREVTQRAKSQKGTTTSIGERRYVLITFYPFKDASLRQKANRLAWKTPLIRIRPGLVIAPHIRISRFRHYEGVLLRPSEYVQQMVELGKTVWYAPKLQLLGPTQERTFEKLIHAMFEERAEFIVRSSSQLLLEAKESSNQPGWMNSARGRLNLLRTRLRQIRTLAVFFQREFGFDNLPIVTRTAAKVSRIRQKVLNI